jgi:hypothetical protein
VNTICNVDVTLISNFIELKKMRLQWNALLKDSTSATFFLTWEWMISWSEVYINKNRKIFILLFHEKNELIGIAPFYISYKKWHFLTIREVNFLGTPDAGSDYIDVFARKGCEDRVSNAVYDYLMIYNYKCWDQLKLESINSNSLFLAFFINRINKEGKYCEVNIHSFCPLLKIPDNETDFYAMLSTGWRKKFKQDSRVSKRNNICHTVISGNDVMEKLDDFFNFYEEKSDWPGTKIRDVLSLMMARWDDEKPIQIDLLSVNGQWIAAVLHLRFQDKLAMYLMATDKKYNPKVSLGGIIVGNSILNAINSDSIIYDFLRGTERYKFHWANEGCSTMQIRFWQKHSVATCSAFFRLSRHFLKVLLR